MADLVNPETNLVENVDPEVAKDAFLSGKYNLPTNQKIPLVDAQGNIGTVDASEVQQAISQGGFKFPNESELREMHLEEQYGAGGANSMKAFAAEAARTGTLGLSDQAMTHLGITSPEALHELKQRHPVATGLGLAAGILTPTPLPKGVGRLGGLIEEGASKLLPEATSFAGKILKSGATKGLGSAVEGALYAGGNLVSEQALGTPELTAQRIASELGMGALWGGGLGVAIGSAKPFFRKDIDTVMKKMNQGIDEELPGLSPELQSATATTAETSGGKASTLEGSLDEMNIPEAKKKSFLEGLSEKKENAAEIEEAGKLIGAPVIESQISKSKHVQDIDSMLMQSPTPTGVARQNLVAKGVSATEKAVDESLGPATEITQAELGNQLKEAITTKFEAGAQPFEQLYNDIKAQTEMIPISQTSTKRIGGNILRLEGLVNSEGVALSPGSAEYQLVSRVAKELQNITSVDELRTYGQILKRSTFGNPELRYVAGQIQERLKNLEESAITRFARNNFLPDSPIRQSLEGLIAKKDQVNAQYGQFREKMQEFGKVLGKKKIYGAQDFIDFVDDMTPEKIASKLFSKDNSEFLQFFQQEFPEETKLLGQYVKSELRSSSLVDGIVQPKKVLREIEKLSPEVQSILFSPEEIKKIEASKTWLEALPKNINPSGTSKSEAYRRFFTNPISATIESIKDKASLTAIESLVNKTGGEGADRVNALLKMEQLSQKAFQKIQSGAKTFINSVIEAAPKAAGSLGAKVGSEMMSEEDTMKQFNLRKTDISTICSDPQLMMEKLEKTTAPIYEYAPNLSQAVQMTAMRAMQFLNSKIPQSPQVGLFNVPMDPNIDEVMKFNRYYDAVQNPKIILEEATKGTLTPEGIEAMQAVHADLLQEMQAQIIDRLTSTKKPIPPSKRLMLSMILGQDVDGSMSGEGFLKNQMALNGNQMAKKAQEQVNTQRVNQKGLEKLGGNNRMLLPMDKSAMRLS